MTDTLSQSSVESEDQRTISTLSNLGLPYVWIPFLILDFYGPGMGKAGWLYTILTRIADTKTKVIVKRTVREIAVLCGCNPETVLTWASHLEELGLIDKKPGDTSNTNVYTLLLPPFPPPPHIVKKHFPEGWKPPASALEAAKNVGFLMTGYGKPQDVGGAFTPKEDVRKFRTTESDPKKGDNPIRNIRTTSTENPNSMNGKNVQPVRENQTLINKTVKKETNEQEVLFVRSLYEFFKSKSTNTTYDRFEEIWFKCLNMYGDEVATAEGIFKNAVEVINQSKTVNDPEGFLWRAIENRWEPRAKPAKPSVKVDISQNDVEKQYEQDLRQERLKAPVESILISFDFFKKHDKKSDPLEIVKNLYKGNPNLEQALKRIIEGGV